MWLLWCAVQFLGQGGAGKARCTGEAQTCTKVSLYIIPDISNSTFGKMVKDFNYY